MLTLELITLQLEAVDQEVEYIIKHVNGMSVLRLWELSQVKTMLLTEMIAMLKTRDDRHVVGCYEKEG